MSEPASRAKITWSLGPALILIGIVVIILSRDIPETSQMSNHDPGPRAFPVAISCLLILGGVYELLRSAARYRRENAGSSMGFSPSVALRNLGRPENRDALILIGALTVYLLAMPWIGFPVSTLLFASGMMLHLGAGWRLAVPVSVGLVAVIYLLFVLLFRVQLPAGVLGLSW